eukprot:COSAG03_NODE_25051_length_268_cov_0.609467_1_plen_23_part_10
MAEQLISEQDSAERERERERERE